ncbi:MAG TPA: Spy/CpxP family protein refolding chaperone [Pyrinomonadaceae bacterium]
MREPDAKSSRGKFERCVRRENFALALPALLVLFLTLGGATTARAQGEEEKAGQAPAEVTRQAQRELEARRRGANAAGLLRILNLTPQQRAQVAAIRRETEPQGRLLGARLRQARRALDEAIYAPNADESTVEERAREVAAAQAAVVRLRSLTELRIRRVLSPEQLDAFRRLQRETLLRRRMNAPSPPEQDGWPGDSNAPFRNPAQRRRQERQQQRRLRNERNAPTRPPLPSPIDKP